MSSDRVIRGSSWSCFAYNLRSAQRYYNPAGIHHVNVGFRLVCDAETKRRIGWNEDMRYPGSGERGYVLGFSLNTENKNE